MSYLYLKYTDKVEEEQQARWNLVLEAGLTSRAHIQCINGQPSRWEVRMSFGVTPESRN